MSGSVDRRQFMGVALASAALAGLTRGASAAAGTSQLLQARQLAPGVRLITGAGGAVVSIEDGDSAVLVDSGSSARARDLLALVQPGKRRVKTLINTHCHADHTGGNELLARAGAGIIAHENTRLWMQRPVAVPWEQRVVPAFPRQAWPTSTFYTDGALRLGSHDIRYGWLGQAHSDGDLYVHLPASNVLITGDTVTRGTWPMPDWTVGGWIGGLVDAGKQLLPLCDETTLIVTGGGDVVNRSHLQAQTDMLDLLKERIWQLMRKGMSDLDIVEAKPTAEYDSQWGDPRLFLINTYKGLWGHVREQRGVV